MSVKSLPPTQAEATRRFASGLLNPAHPPPDDLAGTEDSAVNKRYAVYRNNVTVSLIDALASIYPAVLRITGTDFFRAMARFHIRATPPVSPLLFAYGRDFPAFIASYEYARELPWLADVARIERAWLDAYHAADAPTLSIESLAALDADRLTSVRFIAHPAAQVIRSSYPAVTLFAMHREAQSAISSVGDDAQDALITRPDHDVIVSHLPAGGAEFLTALIGGATLSDAVDTAMNACASFDVTANIDGMMSAGVFCAIHSRNSLDSRD
ncbi:HvfC/BufC N-terminal domain-containing protein [Pandoraea anhela]|uniref:Putative DNA-binding domain-containing protein n=1 Tax=Pandoraea anhela TaxID=2508295 RepID=A0A5E4X8Q2_9BURK|nr:DNA-binding domain-containing protein [Pandoraea anhela]VVE32646.1 hypothetical protein PAN31108_03712 [Pandoraea anhela]